MLGPSGSCFADFHLVRDVVEGVRVHVVARGWAAVAAGATEVHRTGVDECGADQPHVGQQLDVAIPVLDRRPDARSGVTDDAGMRVDDGLVRRRVRGRRVFRRRGEIVRVRVNDGCARVDARERVFRVLLGRDRHQWGAGTRRHAVQRGFDDDGRFSHPAAPLRSSAGRGASPRAGRPSARRSCRLLCARSPCCRR